MIKRQPDFFALVFILRRGCNRVFVQREAHTTSSTLASRLFATFIDLHQLSKFSNRLPHEGVKSSSAVQVTDEEGACLEVFERFPYRYVMACKALMHRCKMDLEYHTEALPYWTGVAPDLDCA